MKAALILKILRVFYQSFLRSLLLKAVDDPEAEWDNYLMSFLDGLLGYVSEGIDQAELDKIVEDAVKSVGA